MKDTVCIQFLQWALPRLCMRWPGFRKVRKQVCKRINRRLKELDLPDVAAYQNYLESHPDEWNVLDDFCRITISRFYRDKGVFEVLARETLPTLMQAARDRGASHLRCWSAGCASGEEPYTLVVLWNELLRPQALDLSLSIIATEADPHMIERAKAGRYSAGSLKDLPSSWRDRAFEMEEGLFRIRDKYRERVEFRREDLRREMPAGPFDLILCRNLAFTYFGESVQEDILQRLIEKLRPGGRLVIGQHESLPVLPSSLWEDRPSLGIFSRVAS